MLTDVDGTLVSGGGLPSERCCAAARAAYDAGVPVVVATGRARGPWAQDVLPALGRSAGVAGVFVNGAVVADADGRVVYSESLTASAVETALGVARGANASVVACRGAGWLCAERDARIDVLGSLGESYAEELGADGFVAELIRQPPNKLILMADDAVLDELRPDLEAALGRSADLTTALPGMLEVMPPGVDKASGALRVLEVLGVPPERALAIGDGENDLPLLNMCGVAVAVGNAKPAVKEAADHVVAGVEEDGFAEALERFVL